MARHPPPTSKARWTRRRPPPPANTTRPKLSPEDVEKLKKLMKQRFKWDEDPRFFQLAGTQAQLEGCDMIIQAPTGSGKTAVAAGPHVWPASANKTTIMVCPLLALEDEMVETFHDDFDLTAVAVNSTGGKLTGELIEELVSGKYRIVLISPEMLQSPAFINRVLRNPGFSRRILSVVIDEAHCVSHWGAGFRKKYSSLGIIRAFLPRGTPIIAVTATLTARVRRDLHRVLHFPRTGSRFINLGNDRSNVSIVVRACEHPQNSYADLDFIIPQVVSSPVDIPKTYLYVDDIRVGGEVINHLNSLLARRAPALLDMGLIRPYNATLSHDYRRAAMKAFRASPDSVETTTHASDSDTPRCIRILVCTDAAGMGCNVGDVDLVVQWKLPKTLSSFVQRAGRAARSKSRTGLAVLLVERSAYSVDLRPFASTSGEASAPTQGSNGNAKKSTRTNQKAAAAPKGYAKDHGVDRGSNKNTDAVALHAEPPRLDLEAADEGLVTFVQAVTCRRKIWAEVFESVAQASVPGVPCCDICAPTLFDRCRPGKRVTARKSKMPDRGHPDLHAYSRLDDWREEIFARDHPLSQLDASSILDDATIRTLTTVGSLTAPQVAELLELTWTWWPRYGQELTAVLTSMQISYRPLPKKTKKSKTTVTRTEPSGSGEAQAASKRSAPQANENSPAFEDAHTPAKRARTTYEASEPDAEYSYTIEEELRAPHGPAHSQWPRPTTSMESLDRSLLQFTPSSVPSYPSTPAGAQYSHAASIPPQLHSSVFGTPGQPASQPQGVSSPAHLSPGSYAPYSYQPPATPVRYAGQSGFAHHDQSGSALATYGHCMSTQPMRFPYTPTPSTSSRHATAGPSLFRINAVTQQSSYAGTPPRQRYVATPVWAPQYSEPAPANISPDYALPRSTAAQVPAPPVHGAGNTHPGSALADPVAAVQTYPSPAPSAHRPDTLIHGSHPHAASFVPGPSHQHVAGTMLAGYPAYSSPAPSQYSP